MSARMHCDRCGVHISNTEIALSLHTGLVRGSRRVENESLDICASCCKREPVLEGYFRAMHTTTFLGLLGPAPKALPDTAAGSALGNASVLPG